MQHLNDTNRAVILTVNSKAAAVMQDAEAGVAGGTRHGLEDVRAGRVLPMRRVFDEIRGEHGMPR